MLSSLGKVDRASYSRNIEDLRVQRSVVDTAIREGKAEGRAEGRIEGKAEEQRHIARNMLANHIDLAIIARCTGLLPEEIEKL